MSKCDKCSLQRVLVCEIGHQREQHIFISTETCLGYGMGFIFLAVKEFTLFFKKCQASVKATDNIFPRRGPCLCSAHQKGWFALELRQGLLSGRAGLGFWGAQSSGPNTHAPSVG